MWPFKSKYDRLTREDVNEAILKLDSEIKKIDEDILLLGTQIDEITGLAKKEPIREIKLNYIKRISYIKRRRVVLAKRSSYPLYNIELMEKLKQAIDDNQLFKMSGGLSLNKLIGDQKGLRKFLVKSLNIKTKNEQSLVDSNDVFEMVDELYDEKEEIYGKSQSDDELLAAFEREDGMLDGASSLESVANDQEAQKGEN